MHTLGVDLASDPATTALCVLEWQPSGAGRVVRLGEGIDDELIVEGARTAVATAIDAPFGWPKDFAARIAGRARWDQQWTPETKRNLRFRATDRETAKVLGRPPLSVSADRIAMAAMRCAGLLHRMNAPRWSSDSRIVECYPAVALKAWGLRTSGYKGKKKRDARASIAEQLIAYLDAFEIPETAQKAMVESDHILDAFVSSLVARAYAIGLVLPVSIGQAEVAEAEGWIQIPGPGSLRNLGQATQ